ncbi:MAG TPA: ribonuclease E inhibitor RraB [Planctomycetota bacterium]|nr:ribonuclease E inhibitor RraB [Planctomycetota bacterium]
MNSQNIMVYHRWQEDAVHKITVDRNADTFRERFPAIMVVTGNYINTVENGLPANIDAFEKIETRFSDLFSLEPKGIFRRLFRPRSVYAGSNVGESKMVYFCYGAAAELQSFAPLRTILGEFKELVDCKIQIAIDKPWENFYRILHPGIGLQSLLLARAQVDLRRKNGDKVDVPREVNHEFLFNTSKDRTRFTRWVNKRWDNAKIRVAKPEDSKYGLTVTIIHPVDEITVDLFVYEFSHRAGHVNGDYDGFGAYEVSGSG